MHSRSADPDSHFPDRAGAGRGRIDRIPLEISFTERQARHSRHSFGDEDDLARSGADLQVRGAGKGTIGWHRCDLEDPATFEPALAAAESTLQGLDTVVVTAGMFASQETLEADPVLLGRLLQVNFTNTVLFCEAARKRLLARGGGTLCAFSSVAGDRGRKPVVLYGASKAGLSHYTAGLRQEVGPKGIGTTLVEIGSTATAMDDATQNYGPYRKMRGRKSEREVQMPVSKVVDAIVEAVKHDRRHVRLPRALASLGMFNELPRRLGQIVFDRLAD